MDNANDHLTVLELKPGATRAEIKRAYRQLAMVWHPDRFEEDSELHARAHEKFKQIGEAYRYLVDHTSDDNEESVSADESSNDEPSTENEFAEPAQPKRQNRATFPAEAKRYLHVGIITITLIAVGFIVWLTLPERGQIIQEKPSTRLPVEKFVSLFNGHNLDGWDGHPDHWSVRDGMLIGQLPENTKPYGNFSSPIAHASSLVYQLEEFDDFELRAEFRATQGLFGIRYRGQEHQQHEVTGYSYQIWTDAMGIGISTIGALGWIRDESIPIEEPAILVDTNMTQVEIDAFQARINEAIRWDGWNNLTIRAEGNSLHHEINGVRAGETKITAKNALTPGVIAIANHYPSARKSNTIEIRSIEIKKLPFPN